jgi:hypothetical protein
MELRDEYHVALDRLSNFAHALIKAVELEKSGTSKILDSISTKTASIGLQDVPRNCFAHVLMQSAALGDLGYANLGV